MVNNNIDKYNVDLNSNPTKNMKQSYVVDSMYQYEKYTLFYNGDSFTYICPLNQVKEEIDTIAWAFLKPVSSNRYINKKLKLQLYKPKKVESKSTNFPIYSWWKEGQWELYPSILNVIVKSLRPTETNDAINNIKLNVLQNICVKRSCNVPSIASIEYRNDCIKFTQRPKGQNCAIPNTIVKCINNIEKCSNFIKFSHCGKYLACGVLKDSKQTVMVYLVPQFTVEAKLTGHKSIIYDICWNATTRLITASADSTVCLWDISNANKCLLQKMVHPAFVYSSKFCPINENIVVTGCYDKVVRVWMTNLKNDANKYNIHQELQGHEGFVNAICFVARSQMFYSGDSVGVIIKWTHDNGIWIKVLMIDSPQFKNKIINDLQIFPDNHRILVVIRNSPSWTFDVATSAAFTCYKDGIDSRYQMRGIISPCSTLVFIGNNIWEASTGHLLAIYNPSAYDHHSIMTVDYHPQYHVIATGCGLNGSPLLCCEYQDTHIADPELGLEIVSPNFQYLKNNITPHIRSVTPVKTKMDLEKINHKYQFADIANNTGGIKIDKDYKLWSLINKMDDAILTVKKGHSSRKDEVFFENELLNDNHIENATNDKTVKVEITEFHKKIELLGKLSLDGKNIQSDDISSDKDTYIVEKEIFKNTSQATNNSSSTLSNAESLEEDMVTYSISNHDSNNIMKVPTV